MLNAEKILFPNQLDINNDSVSIDVSYYTLKNNKVFEDGNMVNSNEQLITIGIC